MSKTIITNEVLGYFNPSTFTIKTSYNPDLANPLEMSLDLTYEGVRAFSNYVHEVSHYIQFSGTVFGLKYQLAQEYVTSSLGTLLRKYVSEGRCMLPFLGDNNSGIWSSEEWKDAITARFLVERCNHIIAGSHKRRAWHARTEYAPGTDDGYPLAGLVLMENWATFNQQLFISDPRIPHRVRSALRDEYSTGRHPDYTIINDRLATNGRGSLAPLIYWIAFNPPLTLDDNNPDWLCIRLDRLFAAALQMPRDVEYYGRPKNGMDIIKYLKGFDDLESQLCEMAEYERPRDCIRNAINTVEHDLSESFRNLPSIKITLDVLGWLLSHDSVWPILLWPGASALLQEDPARTVLRGFPIWLIEYEGQPQSTRWGHNVHNYSGEFFANFEQMRLWRSLLPDMAWNNFSNPQLNCPVPKLRFCPQAQEWCHSAFSSIRPNTIDHKACFLGISFEKLFGVPIDRIYWGTSRR